MFGKLKKLFGGGEATPQVVEGDPVEHEGYRIIPALRKEAQGFRVAGRIELDRDGETLVHEFVRADVYYGEEDTTAVVIQKGKRIIEEQGDRIFTMSPPKAPSEESS